MELEERIFHIGLLISLVGLFLPWLTIGSYGEVETWANGFGFRTGYNGQIVFVLTLFLAFITLSHALGGPIIVRKSQRHRIRFFVSTVILILLLSAFSVLLRITFEVSGVEIRFGIYFTLVGSALSTLYSFLGYQEIENGQIREPFHHPDEPLTIRMKTIEPEKDILPPPPPPPAPPPPEDHHLFSKSL